VIPGYEPDPSIRAEPIINGRSAGGNPGSRNGSGPQRGKRPAGGAPDKARSGTPASRGRSFSGKARRRSAPSGMA